MRRVALAGVVVAALAAAAPSGAGPPRRALASEKTIVLNWREQTPAGYGYPAMTFTVVRVKIAGAGWAVRASMTNRSRGRVRIQRPGTDYPKQYGFGLGWAPVCKPPQTSCALVEAKAAFSKPRLPASLRPGQSWTGVFGGAKRLPRGKLITVTFGYFHTGAKDFSWLSTHSFRL